MEEAAFILVRHAEPLIDEALPPAEWPLSRTGRQAAAALAEKLTAFAPAAAVASPEPKAAETTAIIAHRLGVRLQIDDGFGEHQRPGLPFATREAFHRRMRELFAAPGEPFFGGESADAARARFRLALARHAGRPLLVGTHGTVLALHLAELLGEDGYELSRGLAMPEAFVLDAGQRLVARIRA